MGHAHGTSTVQDEAQDLGEDPQAKKEHAKKAGANYDLEGNECRERGILYLEHAIHQPIGDSFNQVMYLGPGTL